MRTTALVGFGDPLYLKTVLIVLYISLSIALTSIVNELARQSKKDKKLLLWFLLVPILLLVPMPAQHSANTFVHESIASSIFETPFNPGFCVFYENGNCIAKSLGVWTHAYHITLAPFKLLGAHWVKIFNSLCFSITAIFTYLLVKKSGRSPWFTLAFLIPTQLAFISTPVLGMLSMAIGSAMMYFTISTVEGDPKLFDAIATSAFFIHIRPENFVYFLLLLPSLSKKLVKNKKAWGLILLNAPVKVAEYFRGLSVEWLPNMGYRFSKIISLFPANLKFIFNPAEFNLVFAVLLVAGSFIAFRKKKPLLAILPWASLAIYTTKLPGIVFYHSYNITSRYLLTFVVACLPCIYFGLKYLQLPKWILPLAVIPFLLMRPSASHDAVLFDTATQFADELANLSNENGMVIYSMFPHIFKTAERSAWVMDDFIYTSGDYLAVDPRFFIKTHQSDCIISKFSEVHGIPLYNFSCTLNPSRFIGFHKPRKNLYQGCLHIAWAIQNFFSVQTTQASS